MVTYYPRYRQSSTSHTDAKVGLVPNLLSSKRRMSVEMIAYTLHLQITTTQTIMTNNLHM